jgi:acyl carrier protein
MQYNYLGVYMSDIQTRVVKLIAEHLDIDPSKVKSDARFTDDLGADSLDQVEMIMAFEEEFGIEIPDNSAEKIVKVEDAIKYIEEQTNKAA